MAAYKTGAFLRSKYHTPFYNTPLKWIPRSKSGALKSRPRWAAHTRIGNVWEYPPPGSRCPVMVYETMWNDVTNGPSLPSPLYPIYTGHCSFRKPR